MASAQEPGVLNFYRVTPNGSKVALFSADVALLGPSGSADGAIASTPEKWQYIPLQNSQEKVLRVNDQLLITFTARGADSTDASDCVFAIPITYQDGTSDVLGDPDDSTVWDVFQLGDVALVANREYPVCAKTVRRPFALGSNTIKAFASIEDDTA